MIKRYDTPEEVEYFRPKEVFCLCKNYDSITNYESFFASVPFNTRFFKLPYKGCIKRIVATHEEYTASIFKIGDIIRGRSNLYGITDDQCFGEVVDFDGMDIILRTIYFADADNFKTSRYIGTIFTVSPIAFRPITPEEKADLIKKGVIT